MDQFKQHLNNISAALDVAVASGKLNRKEIVAIDHSFEVIARVLSEQQQPEQEPQKESKPQQKSRPLTKN